MAQTDVVALQRWLAEAAGMDLPADRAESAALRLQPLLRELDRPSIGALVQAPSRPVHDRIVAAITTHETSWFRENHAFDVLSEKVVPAWVQAGGGPFRCWSGACSSGQEAYSIAMLLLELSDSAVQHPTGALAKAGGMDPAQIEVLGTDISEPVLFDAASGCYDAFAMSRGLSTSRRERFFVPKGRRWEVAPRVRERVSFKAFDLTQPLASLGHFHCVFLRNILLYMTAVTRSRVLRQVGELLVPGGVLVAGAADASVMAADGSDAGFKLLTGSHVVFAAAGGT